MLSFRCLLPTITISVIAGSACLRSGFMGPDVAPWNALDASTVDVGSADAAREGADHGGGSDAHLDREFPADVAAAADRIGDGGSVTDAIEAPDRSSDPDVAASDAQLALDRAGDCDVPCCTSCPSWSYTPSTFDPLDGRLPAVVGSLLLVEAGTYTYNTSDGVLTSPTAVVVANASTVIEQLAASGPLIRILVVASLEVASQTVLHVTGSLPLVVLVDGDATVAGTIDVSVDAAGAPGPGAGDATLCATALGADGHSVGADIYGAGGAGGGGFGGAGGAGTDGWGVGAIGNGGAGGTASSDVDLQPLRGGCRGGNGGHGWDGFGSVTWGGAGSGAGVLQIAARQSLIVSGAIYSVGGAGGGGPANPDGYNSGYGGGGGGSGGGILLEAADLTIVAGSVLCASGGSGGEGGIGNFSGATGGAGTCAGASTADQVAGGGNGGAGSTPLVATGGAGGVAERIGGVGAGGGGGAGGGAGIIVLRGASSLTVDQATTVSPAAHRYASPFPP